MKNASANNAELLWHMALVIGGEAIKSAIETLLRRADDGAIVHMISENMPSLSADMVADLKALQGISYDVKPFAWWIESHAPIGIVRSVTFNKEDVTELHSPLFAEPVKAVVDLLVESRAEVYRSIAVCVEQIREAHASGTEVNIEWATLLEASYKRLADIDREVSRQL